MLTVQIRRQAAEAKTKIETMKSILSKSGTTILAVTLLCMTGAVSAMESDDCPPAPDFDVETIDSSRISFAELKGSKPLYLKFWLSSCPQCIAEMPHLVHSYEKYGDGIEIVAVNLAMDETMQTLKRTQSDFHLEMPIVFDDDGEMQRKFGVYGTPTHVVIDIDGRIVHFGNAANQELDAALDCVYRDTR